MSYAVGIALCAVGVLLGIILARRLGPRPDGGAAEQERQRLLQAALTEADQIKRDAQVQSKEILLRAQETTETDLRSRRDELEREGQRLAKQEGAQARKAEILASREEEQNRREKTLQSREQSAEATAKRAEELGPLDIMVSASGTIGASVAPTRRRSASRVMGTMRMSCTTP